MDPDVLLLQFMTGLSRAAVLFIVSAGLSLVFGAMRIVNIAHGSFYMIGAFLAVAVSGALGGTAGSVAALVLVPLLVAALAGLVEIGVLRRLYGKEHLLQLLATFALLLVLHDAVRFVWGERPQRLRSPEFVRGSVEVLGTVFPRYSLFLIGGRDSARPRTLAAAVAHRTWPRHSSRRVNVPLLFTVVFALGAALAAIGGILHGPQTTVLLGMDVDIIIQAFAVVIIGGLGSLIGTAIGSVLVGVTFAMDVLYFPQGAMAMVFLVMVAVLVWRPYGLFGIQER